MENKYYVLKSGEMFLSWIDTDNECISTNFIYEMKLTASKLGAYELNDEKEAKDLANLIYIASGILFEVVENN